MNERNKTDEDAAMANIDATLRQNLSDPFVKEALASGLDLRVFSDSVDKELSSLDALCIADYSAECQQIANLHKRICSCDNILLTLEDLLSTFQNKLADISSEIKTVQEQSVKMQNCLQNRQSAKVKLSQFMDDMCVPELLIDRVLHAPPTDRSFIENLHELHHKLLFAKQQTFLEARACADVSDTLEKLRIESVKKVREFILQKLYACRKPLVNYQLHEDALLRHRFFYEFLLHHDRQIARSVKDEYVETFTKLYTAYFKQYHKSINKLVSSSAGSIHATKDDLLGLVDDGSSGSSRRAPPSGLFSLGMRGSLLDELDSPPVVPHALQPSGQSSSSNQPSLSKESAFRSLQCALADAALSEYTFMSEFFLSQASASQELFHTIFSPSLVFLRSKTEHIIVDSWDLLGLMLSAVILHHYRERALKNGNISGNDCGSSTTKKDYIIPGALNDYWEALLTIILSRAEFVLGRHIGSVMPLPASSNPATSPNAAGSGSDSMWRPHAHPLMRRAVEMAVAVARLARMLVSSTPQSTPPWSDRFNDMALALLNNALGAVSGNYAQSRNKDKLVFVINNYALAADVSTEQLGEAASLSTAAREKLSNAVSLYSEVTIGALLPKLAGTVRDAELAVSASQQSSEQAAASPKPAGSVLSQQGLEASVTAAITEFNGGWKRCFEALQRETMAAFPDWRTGSRVFQAAAAHLVDLYQRLLRCLTSPLLARLPNRHDAVSIHTVVVELKRYKTAF